MRKKLRSRNASLGGSVDSVDSVDSVGSVDSVDSDLPVSVSGTDGDLPELVYSSDSDSDAGSDSDGDEDDGNGMPAVTARRSARAREPSGQSLRNVAGGDILPTTVHSRLFVVPSVPRRAKIRMFRLHSNRQNRALKKQSGHMRCRMNMTL